MRRTWASIVTVVLQLLVLGGCYSTPKPKLVPPKRVEEYNLPPADDARFSKALEYPKGTLNQDSMRAKDKDKDPNQPPPMQRPGAAMGGAGAMRGGY